MEFELKLKMNSKALVRHFYCFIQVDITNHKRLDKKCFNISYNSR